MNGLLCDGSSTSAAAPMCSLQLHWLKIMERVCCAARRNVGGLNSIKCSVHASTLFKACKAVAPLTTLLLYPRRVLAQEELLWSYGGNDSSKQPSDYFATQRINRAQRTCLQLENVMRQVCARPFDRLQILIGEHELCSLAYVQQSMALHQLTCLTALQGIDHFSYKSI